MIGQTSSELYHLDLLLLDIDIAACLITVHHSCLQSVSSAASCVQRKRGGNPKRQQPDHRVHRWQDVLLEFRYALSATGKKTKIITCVAVNVFINSEDWQARIHPSHNINVKIGIQTGFQRRTWEGEHGSKPELANMNKWYVRWWTELNEYFTKRLCWERAYVMCGGDWVQVLRQSGELECANWELESGNSMFVGGGAFWEMESDIEFSVDMTQLSKKHVEQVERCRINPACI